MNNDIESIKLGTVCLKIGSGATPRGGSGVYLEHGDITLIRSQNVYNDGFKNDGLVYITEKHASQLSNVTVERNDVLLNITGDSVARCCLVNQKVLPARVNQHVAIIRPDNNKLDPRYLRYFLVSAPMQDLMLSWAGSGGTRNALTKGMIESFEIPCPEVSIQRSIAHILGSLDDKIELNRTMNETLEEMARAIFNAWFVDFDPVRAKAEGRTPFGMDADTAALFPASFQDSPIGKIPKGWKVVDLPEAIDVNPTRRIPRGQTAPYLEMKNMPTNSARALDWYDREFNSGTKFVNGDTLLARITPCLENGKTAYVDFLNKDQVAWGSTEYIVFSSKPPLPPEYTYFFARSDDLRTFAIQNMTGTSGRQRVPPDCFDSYPIVVPSKAVADEFGRITNLYLSAMKQHDEESQTITAIRDTLLPKLMSGEIRIKEAEKFVEAARI